MGQLEGGDSEGGGGGKVGGVSGRREVSGRKEGSEWEGEGELPRAQCERPDQDGIWGSRPRPERVGFSGQMEVS